MLSVTLLCFVLFRVWAPGTKMAQEFIHDSEDQSEGDESFLYQYVFNRSQRHDEETTGALEARRRITDWVSQSKTLRILIFGKTGAGKSSLINTLLGKVVSEEGDDIFSVTTGVSSYNDKINPLPELTRTINGIQVTLWDTPGLQDPSSDGENTLREIERKCKGEVDLFVYCSDMTQTRASQDDFDAIRELTNALGREIWQTGFFALTFANRVRLPPSSDLEFKDYFEDRLDQWQQVLHQAVQKAGVPISDANKIPVVPASYQKVPLPHRDEDWFKTFWGTCISRLRFGSLPAMIRMYQDEDLTEVSEQEIIRRFVARRLIELGDEIDEIDEQYATDMQEIVALSGSPESATRMFFEVARNVFEVDGGSGVQINVGRIAALLSFTYHFARYYILRSGVFRFVGFLGGVVSLYTIQRCNSFTPIILLSLFALLRM